MQKHRNNNRKQRGAASRKPTSDDAAKQLSKRIQSLAAANPPPIPRGPTQGAPMFASAQPGGGGTMEQIGREADAAWQGVQRIISLLNVEEKRLITAGSSTVSYSGYGFDLTSAITQGVSGVQRIGDSLKVRRVTVSCYLAANGAGCAYTAVLGMSRDGYPALADVFALTGASSAGQNFPLENTAGADRWVRARRSCLSSTDLAHVFELTHDFSHDVKYAAGTATVTSGDVWFAIISDLNATLPVLQWTCSIEFVDN